MNPADLLYVAYKDRVFLFMDVNKIKKLSIAPEYEHTLDKFTITALSTINKST